MDALAVPAPAPQAHQAHLRVAPPLCPPTPVHAPSFLRACHRPRTRVGHRWAAQPPLPSPATPLSGPRPHTRGTLSDSGKTASKRRPCPRQERGTLPVRLRKPRGLASAPPSSLPPHFPLLAAGGHCRALSSLALPSPGSGQGSLGKRCWGGLGIKGESNEEASERVRPRRVGVSRVKPRHVELPFSERPGPGQHGSLGEGRDGVRALGVVSETEVSKLF